MLFLFCGACEQIEIHGNKYITRYQAFVIVQKQRKEKIINYDGISIVVVGGGHGMLGRVNEGKKEKNNVNETAIKMDLDK